MSGARKDRKIQLSKKEAQRLARYRIRESSTENLIQAKKFIDLLLKYKKIKKAHSTYTEGVRKAITNSGNGRVYQQYKLDGTATGRLSCAKYENIGISFHTLSREGEDSGNIRKQFIALDKKTGKRLPFITADYKGNELRVIAHFSRDQIMKKAFIEDKDIHTYTATLVYNKPEEKITKEERQICKSASFLIIYGGGPQKLSADFKIPLKTASNILKKYEKIFKDLFKYMMYVHDFIKENGYSYTVLGRVRHLPNVYSPFERVVWRTLRQGFNMIPQSFGSDLTLCAMLGMDNYLRKNVFESYVIGNVHDSIEIASPINECIVVLEELYDQMVYYRYLKSKFDLDMSVPLDIEVIIGHSFGDGVLVKYSKEGKVINKEEIYEYLNLYRVNEATG